jgi:hypothetical protein
MHRPHREPGLAGQFADPPRPVLPKVTIDAGTLTAMNVTVDVANTSTTERKT